MKRVEFDKLYLNKVVHCPTEEKANEFLALADSVGYRWITNMGLINCSQWEKYKEETCYELTKRGFMFANVEYFKNDNYQIIEYQWQLKFKLGDKVRIKSTFYFDGKVGIIVEFNSPSPIPYGVKFDDDVSLWFLSENQLEKVEEPKFKVGDKVRINNTLKVGIIERVNSLRPIPYAVKVDGYSWLWFLTESELEKIEEPKLKAGDKVRVKDTIYTINGKVGIIIERESSLNTMFNLVKIDGELWRLTENQLEKVEEGIYKEGVISGLIEEIKENQKRITALLNRLEQEVKNK